MATRSLDLVRKFGFSKSYAQGKPTMMNNAGIVHEICHWLVAHPWQREIHEYGLGSPVNSLLKSEPILSMKESAFNEMGAVILEAFLLKRINGVRAIQIRNQYTHYMIPQLSGNAYKIVMSMALRERKLLLKSLAKMGK